MASLADAANAFVIYKEGLDVRCKCNSAWTFNSVDGCNDLQNAFLIAKLSPPPMLGSLLMSPRKKPPTPPLAFEKPIFELENQLKELELLPQEASAEGAWIPLLTPERPAASRYCERTSPLTLIKSSKRERWARMPFYSSSPA